MESESKRRRSMRGLAEYLRRRSFPRLALSMVVALTALAGFGISFFLLKAGVGAMWVRYPLAVVGAYGIFLLLIRIWAEIEQSHINPEDPEVVEALEKGAPVREKTKSSRSWLDGLDVPDVNFLDAEGCLVFIFAIVVGAFVILAAVALAGASVLSPKWSSTFSWPAFSTAASNALRTNTGSGPAFARHGSSCFARQYCFLRPDWA